MIGAAAAITPDRVNGRSFNFDKRDFIPAEKPYRDVSALQNKLIGHTLAVNVSLLGVKAMLFVVSGGWNKWIGEAAWWMFHPLLGVL